MSDNWIVNKLCDVQGGWGYGITVDNTGNVYFTATGENIYQVRHDNINAEPQILVNIKGAMLHGIVWNGNNNILYICDAHNDRILSYSIDTGNLSTVVGDGKGHKDGRFKDAQLKFPQAIAMDRNGNLYIMEYQGIRKINLASETVTTVAGDYDRDDLLKQPLFHFPYGIAVSDDGTIYVSDKNNHCITQIKDGVVSTIAGIPGKRGFQVDGLFLYPKALVMDVDGSLLVGDKNGLRRVDVNQWIVSTPQGLPSSHKDVYSLAISNKFGLFVGEDNCIMKIENRWKWRRLVWIGHLKENPNDCLLATLPRDTIKEITRFM